MPRALVANPSVLWAGWNTAFSRFFRLVRSTHSKVTPVCGVSLTHIQMWRQTPLPGVYFSQSRENSWGEMRGRKAGSGKKEGKSWKKGKIRNKVTVLQL